MFIELHKQSIRAPAKRNLPVDTNRGFLYAPAECDVYRYELLFGLSFDKIEQVFIFKCDIKFP